ncbi:MAG: hypothetical protein K9L98_01295 [Candidatus Pacebacteria bacterium]|nr:hypothetical protein [Candidatus Paceibacterota bacterium]MCF7862627.1 hypothetical protein [Candidatus Paceibacterota bacterium]
MDTDAKKILKFSFLGVFFIFIIVFSFFKTKDLIFGVKISGVNIVDGSTIKDSVLKLTGNAKNASKLVLNGREIYIEKDGNFNETIALLSGYNRVHIQAEDKFGNRDEKNYQLIY